MAQITTFASIALAATTNQMVFGTGKQTAFSCPTPVNNQTVSIPDTSTSSTQVILQDNGSTKHQQVTCKSTTSCLLDPLHLCKMG
jgi:hypothetical protein